jgi:hypothetical protein
MLGLVLCFNFQVILNVEGANSKVLDILV